MATGVKKKPGLWDRGMAFDVRVQNVLEKKNSLTDRGVATLVKKKNTGLTNRGVATGVTKFRMASGGLIYSSQILISTFQKHFPQNFLIHKNIFFFFIKFSLTYFISLRINKFYF